MLVNELQLKLEVLQKTLDKKRQTHRIDTSYQSLGSSSTTNLISTPTHLNTNQPLLTSSSSTSLYQNVSQQENTTSGLETTEMRKKIESEKTDRSSTPSQQEYSSSPTSSSASSSSSASPQHQEKQTESTEPTTPTSLKTKLEQDEFETIIENSREFS
ncbi:unnamed protein product [Brachionus calyciflorus]|uniref:Uncharacterized protein n=1 Tax=Brachionus calyciflorus TaxID=104777 RepID=A0A814HT66_9BILA|nr:unnamed protein product [Brachionus calyciflorus]